MNKKIVLIEDDPVLRENTAELLELSNYTVETAPNGKTGVAAVKKELPDIVVCDIMMPELDGYGVLELLSKEESTRRIPFIFLSAKTEHKDIRKGMDLGADDYLTKPFEEDELISAIESRIAKAAILNAVSENEQINHETKAKEQIKNLEELKAYFENEGEYETFKNGEEIYKEGTNANYLYFIYNGVVKTHRLDEYGKELITGLHKGDEFFGYTSFTYHAPNPESATAMEAVSLFKVSKEKLKKILQENPQLMLDFINDITDNLSNIKEQLLQMAYSSVRKKTATTILKFADRLKSQKQEVIKISRSDLASVAGIATESLIRALSSLKKDELIEVEGRAIRVIDLQGLERVD